MRQQWWEPWAEGGRRPAQREEVEVDEARAALEEESPPSTPRGSGTWCERASLECHLIAWLL
jgi:hypothetical protein